MGGYHRLPATLVAWAVLERSFHLSGAPAFDIAFQSLRKGKGKPVSIAQVETASRTVTVLG
jgi:hypothetical protein